MTAARETNLVLGAAYRAVIPFGTAQVYQLFPQVLVGLLGETVIDAWQFLSEEALLPAVVADGAASGLVFWSVQVVCQSQAGEQSQGCDFGHVDRECR